MRRSEKSSMTRKRGDSLADTVQSIDRAMQLLEVLSQHVEGVGLLELSERVNLSKSTVHRLLSTLISNGYVKQHEGTGRYHLTMKMFILGSRPIEKLDVLKVSRPYLEKLRDLSGEVIHLVIMDGSEILYVDKVESENTVRMYSNIGKKGTLYSTSVGKAMLADLDDEEIRRIWNQIEITKKTDYTITDFPSFMEEIRDIREKGYAMDRQENELGVKCMGTSVLDYSSRPVAAFSISGPVQRMTDEKVEELSRHILDAKMGISQELGYFSK